MLHVHFEEAQQTLGHKFPVVDDSSATWSYLLAGFDFQISRFGSPARA
jgi:hypothetical protein